MVSILLYTYVVDLMPTRFTTVGLISAIDNDGKLHCCVSFIADFQCGLYHCN